jgi:Family of unknown function (DUF6489)
MKINFDVDCTPEELRRLMGLPDLSPVHEAWLAKMQAAVDKGVTPDVVEQMVRTWMPIGGQGIDFVRDLMGSVSNAGKGKKS